MKCPKQSPFKKCRRNYGTKKCGGKFIEISKQDKNSTYICSKCDKMIISDLQRPLKKIRKEEVDNKTPLTKN